MKKHPTFSSHKKGGSLDSKLTKLRQCDEAVKTLTIPWAASAEIQKGEQAFCSFWSSDHVV